MSGIVELENWLNERVEFENWLNVNGKLLPTDVAFENWLNETGPSEPSWQFSDDEHEAKAGFEWKKIIARAETQARDKPLSGRVFFLVLDKTSLAFANLISCLGAAIKACGYYQ